MSAKKAQSINLLSGSVRKNLFLLALPIILGNVAQTLYGLVDAYWLGKLGAIELAVITIANPLIQMLVNIGMGLNTATSILISQALGGGNPKKVNHYLLHVFVIIGLGCGLLLLLVGIFLKPILIFLGSSAELISMASSYIIFVSVGIEFYFVTTIYMGLQNALGNSKISFYANVIGLLINLVISPLFIMVFKLSVIGAGIASLISRVVPFVIFAPQLFNRNNKYYIDYHHWILKGSTFLEIVKVALPLSFSGATIQLGFMVMGKHVMQYGNLAMAAYGIGNRISSLVTIPANALGSALTILVGQNYGAKNLQRVKQSYYEALKISVSYLIIFGTLLSLRPITQIVASIFISDTETLQLTIQYVQILSLYCFTNGIYNATLAVFNGVGLSIFSAAIDIARIWLFRIIALELYSLLFGEVVSVVWYSVVFSNGMAAVVIVILYILYGQRWIRRTI